MAIELTTASESVIDSIRASLSAVGSDTIKEIVDITRANYNLLTKDSKTLYVVNEGVGVNRSFFLGTSRIDFSGSISGNLSASGLVYANGGNSSTWNSTTNIININSDKWNSNSTTVSVNSASWIGSTTIVAANSANWVLDGGNTKGANLVIGTNDGYNLALETANSTRLTILSDGNVGIGTVSPSEKLQVTGNIRATGNLLATNLIRAANSITCTGTVSGLRVIGSNSIISATSIDWALASSFYKTIAANTAFTFSNTIPGQSITVAISAAGSYDVTWPATVVWSGNIAPRQTASTTDIYFFHNINNIIYGDIITEAGLSETFTNSQTRLSTIPYRVGLIGFQIDTGEVWVSIGQTAGDWQLVSGAGGVPPSHEHSFSEIHSLPSYPPAALDVIGVPLGEASSRLTHWASLSLILDLARVPRSARDTLLALNDAGVIISDTQLAAIDTFYKYADSSGLITGNSNYARLLVPVWSDNTKANLIDWLHPASSIKPYTRNASTGANNAGNFNAGTNGYMQPTGVTNSGMIDFNSTVAQIWEATDYCFTYYSHLPPLTDDNTMIGARNDTISGGLRRYFSTSRSTTDAGVFRASPGTAAAPEGPGGSLHVNLGIPELYVGGTVGALNPLGLIHFARKGTLFSTRRRGAAGILNTTDFTTSNVNANAIISNIKLGGFLYYNNGTTGSLNAGSALHSQPSSLFYLGRAIATTNTATDTFSLNLYNLAVSMGAPVV